MKLNTENMLRLNLLDKFNVTLFLIMTHDVTNPNMTVKNLLDDGKLSDVTATFSADDINAANDIAYQCDLKDNISTMHQDFAIGTVLGSEKNEYPKIVAVQGGNKTIVNYIFLESHTSNTVYQSSSDTNTVAQVLTSFIHHMMIVDSDYYFHPDHGDSNIAALYNLWNAQLATNQVNWSDDTKEITKQLPKALAALLKTLDNQNAHEIVFSAVELAQFYYEFTNHQLASDTSNVQAWLRNTKQTDYIASVQNDVNYHKLTDMQIVNADNDPEVKQLITTIQHAPYVTNYRPKLIIKLNNGPVANTKHHITLMHGTTDISIIPIILNGLLPASVLEAQGNKDYQESGQALGDGVYFVRPDNAQKALDFGDGSRHVFTFIADVGYDHRETNDDGFGSCAQDSDTDLFVGKNVGYRSFDEYVCRNYHNITLKYLFIA